MTEGERGGRGISRAHRVGWMLAAACLVGAGIVGVLFSESTVSPAGVFVGAATLSVAMVLPFAEEPISRPMRWVELALGAGVGAVGVQGWATWVGWWALLVVAVLAATSPWAVAALPGLRARWETGTTPVPAATAVPPTGTPGPVAGPVDMSLYEVLLEEVEAEGDDGPGDEGDPGLRSLDVEQLCRRWLNSFARLRAAPTPEQVLAVTRERDELLRELTRRDPEGVAAWLAAGPRATGDPRRYLRRRTQDG
jgi:hypothetical protein